MKKLFLLLCAVVCAGLSLSAQTVEATWVLSDGDDLGAATVTIDGAATTDIATGYSLGSHLSYNGQQEASEADEGYASVTYDPPFARFMPDEDVSEQATGHDVTFTLTTTGHTFMPTKISFDACRIGTDKGGIDVVVSDGTTTETVAALSVLRDRVTATCSEGYGHYDVIVNDLIVADGTTFTVSLYVMSVTANSKNMGLRNIVIEGELDGVIYTIGDYLSSFTCTGKVNYDDPTTVDLLPTISGLKNGESKHYNTTFSAEPTDFSAVLADAFAEDHTVTISNEGHEVTITIYKGDKEVFSCSMTYNVVIRVDKDPATPLTRGLMAVHQSKGNLVSWRARKSDDKNLRFMLYRINNGEETVLNDGNFIAGKTNFFDESGKTAYTYRLEVLAADGTVIETDQNTETWSNQTLYIPLTNGAPTDPSGLGATYTPNDCGICDMDGDGQYDIIVKWRPSNEKDAASSGSTSNIFFDCYKMDGTFMWRIDMGQNFFASAHTVQFIAWDFDGDGYGEFMVKTAPGTIDGLGNYVIMGDDDPTANWKNSRGKQVEGPEYITVFDGMTGAEISTIAYHTNYADGSSYWGDSEQNRSERYLAAIAWLDGEDGNPSPIFARGYYSGAFVGAYDFDGQTLSERWVSRNTTSGQGLWGEGAHWISVGDCDGDGCQEIVYGSGALDNDGSLLYRTGLGHGDALHLGDFDPDNDGLEVYMVHEEKPYGMDLRDAKTGTLLLHNTADSDTGRGLAAHLNPEAEGAYLMWSVSLANVYDWDWNLITSNGTPGGGGSFNNNIYWDGLLSEDRYDKSVLEKYNPSSKSFDRIQVNGTNYTSGTLNNDSKYNPCLLADVLGDWREEIINWEQKSDGIYYLVINATNYESDYTVPHLMDDLNYRAQVINQNCAYNQPPHLSYNLRNAMKITREGIEYAVDSAEGNYWDCAYFTYPVTIPDNISAWAVTGIDTDTDVLTSTVLTPGKVLPANTGILYNSADKNVTFVPSAVSPMTVKSSALLGSYVDMPITSDDIETAYYTLVLTDAGLGFARVDSTTVPAGTAYLAVENSTELIDFYPITPEFVTGINAIVDDAAVADGPIYSLQGLRLTSEPTKGVYIKNGKKYVK